MTPENRMRFVILSPMEIVPVGGLATSDVMHRHAADKGSGSSCLACYGWADDPRHLVPLPKARRRRPR